MTQFTDIFISRPYIFANTALRLTRKACWAAWVGGPGSDLHAEYELVAASSAEGECFHWDKVILTKSDKEHIPDHTMYILENEQRGYMIIEHYYLVSDTHEYCLVKHDKEKGIIITVFLACCTCVSDVLSVFNELIEFPCLRIYRVDQLTSHFYQLGDLLFMSQGGDLPPPLPPDNLDDWIQITDHNIESIVDFMKTSRLNISDHLPRYTAVETSRKNI